MEMQQQIQETPEHNPLTRFIHSISSYDSNKMLAAVISLLLAILFVLLLHIYAKWFLTQARHRGSSSSTSVTVSHVLLPSRFQRFHTFDNVLSGSPTQGLDMSVISSIPLFVYKQEEHGQGVECVICLTPFEENDVGRSLTKCDHFFHVECIDMWLSSNPTCPICRAPAVVESDVANDAKSTGFDSIDGSSILDVVVDVSTPENENEIPVMNFDALSESSSSSSCLGCYLKKMLSRNRSERTAFPSGSSTEATA